MILLLGGTTEARQVASGFDEAGIHYIYSTRTEVKFEGKGRYRYGSLDQKSLREFCTEHEVFFIVDACHPFAKELHTTVASLSNHVPVIRFERELSERIDHSLVHYVNDYTEVLAAVKEGGYQSMLALTGVQSIPHLFSFWQLHTCWFRIINRDYSLRFAASHHFPAQNLLFGLPQEKEEEIKLFNSLQPAVIAAKESGINGKLQAKTEAAIANNIPIFIIKKPALPALFTIVHTFPDLLRTIQHE